MNIINGNIVNSKAALRFLDGIDSAAAIVLQSGVINPEIVIAAADALSKELAGPEALAPLLAFGMGAERAQAMLEEARLFLSRGYLETKMNREFGSNPFAYRQVESHIQEKFQPLGVLTHIAAGNAAGLPAFSVLEGLLASNVNLLKLPGGDDGLSTSLLKRLIEIEPRLTGYIQVFDLPSTDVESIKKLLAASDAVAVWGSDFAISGIRGIAPPNMQLIEWGHRLSFAYVTRAGESQTALECLAAEICETEQLLCSAPQCVYYETDSFEELAAFAGRFAQAMQAESGRWPAQPLDSGVQAEITALLALAGVEELVEEKKVLRGDGWSVIADHDPALKPSPMFRTVWVKPLPKSSLFGVLRPQKGYLQTAGLACAPDELEAMSSALYACGVCRVMPCGLMSSNYAGEPHDGYPSLRRYVKTVVRRV